MVGTVTPRPMFSAVGGRRGCRSFSAWHCLVLVTSLHPYPHCAAPGPASPPCRHQKTEGLGHYQMGTAGPICCLLSSESVWCPGTGCSCHCQLAGGILWEHSWRTTGTAEILWGTAGRLGHSWWHCRGQGCSSPLGQVRKH